MTDSKALFVEKISHGLKMRKYEKRVRKSEEIRILNAVRVKRANQKLRQSKRNYKPSPSF